MNNAKFYLTLLLKICILYVMNLIHWIDRTTVYQKITSIQSQDSFV
jgi:hypothetical protein